MASNKPVLDPTNFAVGFQLVRATVPPLPPLTGSDQPERDFRLSLSISQKLFKNTRTSNKEKNRARGASRAPPVGKVRIFCLCSSSNFRRWKRETDEVNGRAPVKKRVTLGHSNLGLVRVRGGGCPD